MKLAVALALNVLLLNMLLAWLRAEYRRAAPELRRWLLPALAWRLLLTALSSHWPSPDARGAAEWSRVLTTNMRTSPAQALNTLQSASFLANGQVTHFYAWSNTLFFIKLSALLNLASVGLLWLNALYLSLGCFVACWGLVRTLHQVFPATPVAAGAIAFLGWPTVVWWTAGLTKETLLVAAGAGLVALVLPALYSMGRPLPPRGKWLIRLLLILLLAWLLLRMRVFFALPLLGGLLALAAVRGATGAGWLGSSRGAQVGALLLLLALGGTAAAALGSRLLPANYFVRELNTNYLNGLRTSTGRPHLAYADWQPTPAGLLRHAPLAAVQVLVRPWPGESATRPLYLGAELENVLLMSLFMLALLAVVRGQPGRLPAALVVLLAVYCLLLAIFIGLSTPNFGTLHRYRAALLPWLLLLLLQNDYARRLMRNLE